MHAPDQRGHLGVQGLRAPGVGAQAVGRARVPVDQRVVAHHPALQRDAVQVLHGEHGVAAEVEQLVRTRHAGDVGEPVEDALLVRQPCRGVEARAVPAGVRPGLLEDHGAAVVPARRGVHAPGVGEVQRLLDPVAELAARRRASLDVRAQGIRDRHALGQRERGPPAVGHEAAVGVGEGEHVRAVVRPAPAFAEGAVAEVHGALAPAAVGEDVRRVAAREAFVQLACAVRELRLVARVDGDELAAGRAGRVLGVHGVEHGPAAQVLEGHAGPQTVVGDDLEDLRGVVVGRGDMDLPALVRGVRLVGLVHVPDAGGPVPPAVGQRGEPRRHQMLLGGGPRRGLEEHRVHQGVDRPVHGHEAPPAEFLERIGRAVDGRRGDRLVEVSIGGQ
ncbi:hypothetical protein [Streptomyces alboflavus]|uniref:hypothetical protein n=1 Tax=Streptomyces alboflavus TaxID=67267 RepID=UPI001331AE3E|nr:hypothetical protein [Streptomyces alboflavus]